MMFHQIRHDHLEKDIDTGAAWMVRLDFADDTDNLTDRALRKIVVVWQVVEERTFRQAVSPEAVRIVRNLMVVGVELLMNLIDKIHCRGIRKTILRPNKFLNFPTRQ